MEAKAARKDYLVMGLLKALASVAKNIPALRKGGRDAGEISDLFQVMLRHTDPVDYGRMGQLGFAQRLPDDAFGNFDWRSGDVNLAIPSRKSSDPTKSLSLAATFGHEFGHVQEYNPTRQYISEALEMLSKDHFLPYKPKASETRARGIETKIEQALRDNTNYRISEEDSIGAYGNTLNKSIWDSWKHDSGVQRNIRETANQFLPGADEQQILDFIRGQYIGQGAVRSFGRAKAQRFDTAAEKELYKKVISMDTPYSDKSLDFFSKHVQKLESLGETIGPRNMKHWLYSVAPGALMFRNRSGEDGKDSKSN